MQKYFTKSVLIFIISAIVTTVCAVLTVSYFLDKKKKREDAELEQYLDGAIQ